MLYEIFSLNNLTNEEYISIVSSLLCVFEERFNYSLKDPKDYSDKREKKKIELYHRRNSKGVIRKEPIFKVEDLEYYTCPSAFYTPEIGYWIELEKMYEKHGHLPYQGNLREQPSKVMQIFKLIRRFINEKQQEEMKKNEAKMRQKYGKK